MRVELPSTITASYAPWLETGQDAPGTVVLRFGDDEIGWFAVGQREHDLLMRDMQSGATGELNYIVARFLGRKLFSTDTDTEGRTA